MTKAALALELVGVRKSYGERMALDGMAFGVPRGSKNGCGEIMRIFIEWPVLSLKMWMCTGNGRAPPLRHGVDNQDRYD